MDGNRTGYVKTWRDSPFEDDDRLLGHHLAREIYRDLYRDAWWNRDEPATETVEFGFQKERIVTLYWGQTKFSIRDLANRHKKTEKAIRTAIKLLAKLGYIAVMSKPWGSIATVTRWRYEQSDRRAGLKNGAHVSSPDETRGSDPIQEGAGAHVGTRAGAHVSNPHGNAPSQGKNESSGHTCRGTRAEPAETQGSSPPSEGGRGTRAGAQKEDTTKDLLKKASETVTSEGTVSRSKTQNQNQEETKPQDGNGDEPFLPFSENQERARQAREEMERQQREEREEEERKAREKVKRDAERLRLKPKDESLH